MANGRIRDTQLNFSSILFYNLVYKTYKNKTKKRKKTQQTGSELKEDLIIHMFQKALPKGSEAVNIQPIRNGIQNQSSHLQPAKLWIQGSSLVAVSSGGGEGWFLLLCLENLQFTSKLTISPG